MVAKNRRYQPTDARRPDLVAQGDQLLALIDAVHGGIVRHHLPVTRDDLIDAACEGLESQQGAEDPAVVAFNRMTLEVRMLCGVERQQLLDTVRGFVDGFSNDQLHSRRAQDKALIRAGVKPRGIRATSNPVGVAIRRMRALDEGHAAFEDVSMGEWLGEDITPGSNVPFKEWAAHVADGGVLTEEQATRLAWGLVLVESQRHLGLVWRIIHRMSKSYPKHSENDLFGWGWHGLCLAIKSYQPTTAAFSTYAARRINGTIRDGVRAENHLPKRLTAVVREIQVAEEALTKDMGRGPSLEELASHVGATLMELELSRTRYQQPASIDELMAQATNDTDHGNPWEIRSDDDPELAAINAVRASAVANVLDKLPEDQRIAVQLMVLDGLAPREAAEITSLTTRQLRRARDLGLEAIADDVAQWVG